MPTKDRERIRKAVLAWRDGMKRRPAASTSAEPLDWVETTGSAVVHRPAGLGRLRLAGAVGGLCRAAGRCAGPPPLPEEWDDDPALVRSNADGFRSRYSHLVRNVELWLPAAFDFTFEGEDVDGRRIIVGSSTTLAPPARRAQRRDLEDGRRTSWRRWPDERPPGTASLEVTAPATRWR